MGSSSSSSIYYNFSGNTFNDISSYTSTVGLYDYFKSLFFSNNSFSNIICTYTGGVFLLFLSFLLFYLSFLIFYLF
jgi:hypothetical protein